MTKQPHFGREDRLGRQLRREVFDDQPPFSPTLQARIMRAVGQQGQVELAKASPLRSTYISTRLLPIGVALVAVLLVCVAVHLARPRRHLIVVDTSQELRSASIMDLAAPLTVAVTDFAEVARSAPDDLVDTVVLTHWNYLDQHTDEIATFLLDPLPIDIQPAALE